MPDLTAALHAQLMTGLGALREAYGHYLHLVDAQRAALTGDNYRLVRTLSERLDVVIRAIQREERDLTRALATVGDPTTDGPRAQEIRDVMTATAADAALAQAGVRDLTRRLVRHRAEMGQELGRSDRPGPTPPSQSAVLDAAG